VGRGGGVGAAVGVGVVVVVTESGPGVGGAEVGGAEVGGAGAGGATDATVVASTRDPVGGLVGSFVGAPGAVATGAVPAGVPTGAGGDAEAAGSKWAIVAVAATVLARATAPLIRRARRAGRGRGVCARCMLGGFSIALLVVAGPGSSSNGSPHLTLSDTSYS